MLKRTDLKASSFFYLMFFLIGCKTLRLQTAEKNFPCPVKNGEIILSKPEDMGMGKPSTTFRLTSNDGKIYSVSKGIIKEVEVKDSFANIYIELENYFFSYQRLKSTSLIKGNKISEGDLIGNVDRHSQFYFSIRKDGIPISPEKVLKCRVVFM